MDSSFDTSRYRGRLTSKGLLPITNHISFSPTVRILGFKTVYSISTAKETGSSLNRQIQLEIDNQETRLKLG
jgi:hypothetical protein